MFSAASKESRGGREATCWMAGMPRPNRLSGPGEETATAGHSERPRPVTQPATRMRSSPVVGFC